MQLKVKKMDKKNKQLEKYHKLVGVNSLKARKEIEKIKFQNDTYLLSCIALTFKDEAVFFKNGNMRKIFLKKKLDLAKNFIDDAFKLNPTCRDMLFIKGAIYNALGDKRTAIDCYIQILKLDENLSKEYNCSNSNLAFVQMLLNDARFQLYRLFYDLEDFDLSSKFLKEYKSQLKKGIDTIYKPLEYFSMGNRGKSLSK
jgi:tetratricopeptide (TPR) repeat protein